jgi:hypothetical protein
VRMKASSLDRSGAIPALSLKAGSQKLVALYGSLKLTVIWVCISTASPSSR